MSGNLLIAGLAAPETALEEVKGHLRPAAGDDIAAATHFHIVVVTTLSRRLALLLIRGVPERAVMGLTGWSTTAMAARYQHSTAVVRGDLTHAWAA